MSSERNFRNHFDTLDLHHKGKFWQSYVRALKGTEGINANENPNLRVPRAVSELPDFFKNPVCGYRYQPISRETYGPSPRPIYPRPYLRDERGSSVPPEWLESGPARHYPRSHYSPVPWQEEPEGYPEPSSYTYDGGVVPMYGTRGGLTQYRPYSDMVNPSPNMPMSMITRDPWWYDACGLRPYSIYPRYPKCPSALRNSYLSPVKNKYLWTRHPLRTMC